MKRGDVMAMISIRLNDRDASLIRSYAQLKGISLSDLIRNTVINKIEDEIDIQYFNDATKSLRKTLSLDELEQIVRGVKNV